MPTTYLYLPAVPGRPDFLDGTQACARVSDPEVFFRDEDVRGAVKVCRKCPLKDACLAWALEHNETEGVWGATTAKQRRKILRRARR